MTISASEYSHSILIYQFQPFCDQRLTSILCKIIEGFTKKQLTAAVMQRTIGAKWSSSWLRQSLSVWWIVCYSFPTAYRVITTRTLPFIPSIIVSISSQRSVASAILQQRNFATWQYRDRVWCSRPQDSFPCMSTLLSSYISYLYKWWLSLLQYEQTCVQNNAQQ